MISKVTLVPLHAYGAQEWLYYYTTCGKAKIYSTCRRGHDSIACERLRLLSEAEFYKVKG